MSNNARKIPIPLCESRRASEYEICGGTLYEKQSTGRH